jgi:hypothetical protein
MADDSSWVPTKESRDKLFEKIQLWLFSDKHNVSDNWRHVFYLSAVLQAELAFRMKAGLPASHAPYNLDDAYFNEEILPQIRDSASSPQEAIQLLVDIEVWLVKQMGERIVQVELFSPLPQHEPRSQQWSSDP